MTAPRVYLVTDRRVRPDIARAVERALEGAAPGSVAVQLREKDLGGLALLALARSLVAICARRGALLLVNDRVDVALAAGAAGVHLPASGIRPSDARRLLGPTALVAVSCHDVEEVRRAREEGASFATFGPVFDTPSKRRYGAPVGLAALTAAAAVGLPLVGLGGIDAATAATVRAAGAVGVAAIRAWLAAEDPAEAVRALAGAEF